MNSTTKALVALVFLALWPSAQAAPESPWSAALRFRLEQVERTDFERPALASTARLRIGFNVPIRSHLNVFAQSEMVLPINDRFNSGANRQHRFPSVADAAALEWNQAGATWRTDGLGISVGRQIVSFDNQRFIGNVGWRQNEQSFDSVLLSYSPDKHLNMQLGWLDRVHRVNGDRALDPGMRERKLNAPVVHATFGTGVGPLSSYFYGVEDGDVATASTKSWGLRWTPSGYNAAWRWSMAMEAAQQSNYRNNPLRFQHSYQLFEASFGHEPWYVRVGRERLAGDGIHAFQTPLATLHAFNGWADQFATTPNVGLIDRYLLWTTSCPQPRCVNWTLAWHRYDPDRLGDSLGREWNASIGYELGRGWRALIKLADYQGRNGPDVRKVWLQLEWEY